MERVRTAEAPRASAAGILAAALPLGAVLLLLAVWLAWPGAAGAAVNTAPPAAPVKLVFVHHSTGEAWLADGHGGLGVALRDNNYFVSDTNYGWGPDAIGDTTDLGHWWTWFRSPDAPTYMNALYAESGQNCSYSRLAIDPSGENEIVMFKSCFPNSQLSGPDSPAPAIADNPMKGQSSGGGDFTVANAKGIYLDLLGYFGAHPEKLFVAVVAPPVTTPDTPGGRALANWLVDHWLQDSGYTAGNVFVFDYYDVLSSSAGGGASDVGLASGNHHRVWNGAVEHKTDGGADRLAYPSAGGDSHPNAAGDRKATAELLPLLNNAYNAWKGNGGGGDTVGPRTFATRSATVRKGKSAALYYRVTDDVSASATVTIRVRTRSGALKKTLALGVKGTGPERHVHFTCRLARGSYRFTVDARDLAGNAAQRPLGSNKLTVR
ncbi:MAG: hypothetical protein IMZ74_02175 [Actinobacteria bacterium]|nr:hypothetical protein [Actinomycetota bacterium]